MNHRPTLPTARPWQPCGAAHVAVYGTLRAGGVNDIARLRDGIVRTGTATLTGTLHDIGWYPALRLQGSQSVLAEVYPLDDALEQALDGIEGIWPRNLGEYAKRLLDVRVQSPDGRARALTVLVYEALPALVRDMPVIAASDWIAWHGAKMDSHEHPPFQLRTESSAAPWAARSPARR